MIDWNPKKQSYRIAAGRYFQVDNTLKQHLKWIWPCGTKTSCQICRKNTREQQQLIFQCFNHLAPKEFYKLSTLSSPAIIPFKGWWRPCGLRWWRGVGNLSKVCKLSKVTFSRLRKHLLHCSSLSLWLDMSSHRVGFGVKGFHLLHPSKNHIFAAFSCHIPFQESQLTWICCFVGRG